MALNYKSSLTRYRRYLAAAEESTTWKASIFVVFSLVLMAIMIIFALRPTLLTIADLVTQIKEQEALSARLAEKIDDVREASDVLSSQRSRLVVLDAALPQTPEWISWVQRVEGLATESSVVVDSIAAGPVATMGKVVDPNSVTTISDAAKSVSLPKGAGMIPFTIAIHGDYDQVRKFAEQLDTLRRVTVISNLHYAKEKDGTIATTITGWIGYMTQL